MSFRPTVPPKTPQDSDRADYFNFGTNPSGQYLPVAKQDPVVEHQELYRPYVGTREDIELDNFGFSNKKKSDLWRSDSVNTNRDLPPTPPHPISKDDLVSRSKLVKQYYPYEDPSLSSRAVQYNHGNSVVDNSNDDLTKDDFNNPYNSSYRNVEYQSYHNESGKNEQNGIPPINTNDTPENPFTNVFDDPSPRTLLDQKIRENERQRVKLLNRKPRFHYTRLPYFTIVVTAIQIAVFIAELVKMGILTGLPFQSKPYFNPMLGPSTYLLINMGARYVPCMQQVIGITNDTTIQFPCPNSTSIDTDVCLLSELCGMLGVPIVDNVFKPHQWYRVITPIFLHAGFLHIIFNLLLQVTMGATIERNIGGLKFALIYLASGIAGFILGANYTPNGIALTGASGALFGIVATNMIMFAYCGKKNTNLYGTKRYALFIAIMVAEIVILLVLGLLPGMDNFLHIGGFVMGCLMAITFLPDPFFVYEDGVIAYNGSRLTWEQFCDSWNPKHNWDYKIPSRVYLWMGARVSALALIGVFFGTLMDNFFDKDKNSTNNNCKWCKYINCIPVNGWCDIGNVSLESTDNTSSDNAENASSTASATPTPSVETLTSLITSVISNPSATDPVHTTTSSSNTGAYGGLKRDHQDQALPTITPAVEQTAEQILNFDAFNDILEPALEPSLEPRLEPASNVHIPAPQSGSIFMVMVFLSFRFFRAKNWI